MKMTFQEIRIIATGPCIANQLRDVVLSDVKFDKPSLVSTAEGKSIASTYLTKNIEALDIKENIIIDIDSETKYFKHDS
jgi:hypothetical protein